MHLYPMPLAMYVVIMVNICIGYGPCFWITMLGVEALSQRRLCNGLQVLSGGPEHYHHVACPAQLRCSSRSAICDNVL